MAWPIGWLLDAAARGGLSALLLLMVGLSLRDSPRSARRDLGVAMGLGLVVQTFASTPWIEAEVPLRWSAPVIALAQGNAVVFWLYVRALVEDDFQLRPRHLVLWAVVVGFVWINFGWVVGRGAAIAPWLMVAHRGLSAIFALLSAVVASRHWRDDLVEPRRHLRAFVVIAGIAYATAMVLARAAGSKGRLGSVGSSLDIAMLWLIVGVLTVRRLRLSDGELFPTAPLAAIPPTKLPEPSAPARPTAPCDPPEAQAGTVPAPAASLLLPSESTPTPVLVAGSAARPDPAEQRLADALQHAMDIERVYRSEDLSVATLAARLAVPEYRLRRLINQRLGHRNFSAFVNGYRLAEARAALADPARRELPILTVALDAGFQSIGPFNRAFKADTGLTPGDFRRQNLAES